MPTTTIFIPMDRRRALAEGATLSDRTTGAALFADISGFTPLTGALYRELGRQRGAEAVLQTINPVYEAIIAPVHAYGGSVIGFAGDAITCWLDGDDGRRAMAAALAMQQAMRAFETVITAAGSPVHLGIKIAIAQGPVRRFVVGEPHICRVDVLAGSTLNHMAAGEHLAEKGEILAQETVIQTQGWAADAVTEWRSDEESGQRFGVVRPDPDRGDPEGPNQLGPAAAIPEESPEILLSEEVAREWLLPPVYQRLQGGGGFLAELRPAVALFLKFQGIDYDDDPEAGQKLDNFIRRVQAILARYEGYLIQLTLGDKGSYLYAAFGAPLSHDDDPSRAVAAALDLRDLAPSLEFINTVQIGISRGRMWSGAYGSSRRSTYGVMGNETNMAARLMARAQPNQILISGHVAETLGDAYRLNFLGPVVVKGGQDPIPVSEVMGRQQVQVYAKFTAPLLGRAPLRAALAEHLAQASRGQGRIISLLGPAGIGKSHLMAVFNREAAGQGVTVAVGTCQSTLRSTPYSPWRTLLGDLLDAAQGPPAEGADGPARLTQIRGFAADHALDWTLRLPVLGDLLDLPLADNPTTAGFDPKRRQETLTSLVGELLQVMTAVAPLLLVVENAQWMDEASTNLLVNLAHVVEEQPILCILVGRSLGGDDQGTQALADLTRTMRLTVPGFDPEEMAQLVTQALSGSAAPLIPQVIHAKTNGNPLFAKEMLSALRQADEIVVQTGVWQPSNRMLAALQAANSIRYTSEGWQLAPDADGSAFSLNVPDSIHGIYLARMDRLVEELKLSLKTSSAVGYRFEVSLVQAIHAMRVDIGTLRSQLAKIEQQEFIVSTPVMPGVSGEPGGGSGVAPGLDPRPRSPEGYTFYHHTAQEVAYATLLFAQRRQLHGDLAQALLERHPERVAEVAYHASLGESWGLALDYQMRAGRQAKQLSANHQAIDHFRKAHEAAQQAGSGATDNDQLTIHAALGELYTATGQYDEAETHLGQAMTLAQSVQDHGAQGQICRWFARLYEVQGEYAPALEWVQRGVDALGHLPTVHAEEAEILLIAGLIDLRKGDYEGTLRRCQRSLEIGKHLADATVIARTYNLLGIRDRRRGDDQTAIGYFRQALALYQQADDAYGQAISNNQIANAYFRLGDLGMASDHYGRAQGIFARLGDYYHQMMVSNNLGGIALKQAAHAEAQRLYSQALALLSRTGGSLWAFGTLHMNLGHALLVDDQLNQAFDHLRQAGELFDQAQVRELLPELHWLLAEAHLRQGALDKAHVEGERALALAREMEMRREEGLALRVLGNAHLAQGQTAQADTELTSALDIFQAAQDEYEIRRCQADLARLALAQNK